MTRRGIRGALVVAAAGLVVPLVARAEPRAELCDPVPVWRDGHRAGSVCRADAAAHGLTVIDLGDDWTPPVFGPFPGGVTPDYRAAYLALSDERFEDAGRDGALARNDRYLELYGVVPSIGVARNRLDDEDRHRCHDAVEPVALAPEVPPVRGVEGPRAAHERLARAVALRAVLANEARTRHLGDVEDLAADPRFAPKVAELAELENRIAVVRMAQEHLVCDGLLARAERDGRYTRETRKALRVFQRGALILPTGTLDAATVDALAAGSRELAFRGALRVLRERVIAASGLIEDGTAGTGSEPVLGRMLDPETTLRVRGYEPLPDAAPDLISPATEVAARALGWRDVTTTRAFLDDLAARDPAQRQVAIELPPVPRYHTRDMAITAEIDRGDVWHDKKPRNHDVERRPALVVYAQDGDRRIALVRWPTTIGGWQRQQVEGEIEEEMKESPVGPRIWRDLYVGPRWLPPDTTPDRELVRRSGGHYVLARELFGPSYRAAFGVVAFIHLKEDWTRDGVETSDEGIRTHATGNVVSIANGVSHGCHRLLGMHAVRLADFVLAHHRYAVRGPAPTSYHRVVHSHGRFPLTIKNLGYRLELDPPIAVEVLPGRTHR